MRYKFDASTISKFSNIGWKLLDAKITSIFSDGGYIKYKEIYFLFEGIILLQTPPYTPEHNGVNI